MTLVNRDGKLWITFYHQSTRYRKSLNLIDTKQNRKYAQQTLIPEIQYKLNSGEFFNNDEKKVPTVGEFAQISFEIHQNERREFTQKRYIRLYEIHIKPHFEKRRLDQIKPSELARWQNNLLTKITGKTVKGIRTVFYTLFEDARKDEIITRNPFSLIRSPKDEEFRVKNPFSKEEIFAILKAMPEHIKAFFAIGFFTGLRTGEIIGLKWEDFDFDDRSFYVERSRRQGTETLPKTKNSVRTVEIIDVLMPFLLRHREICSQTNVYVFETYEGLPYNTCDKISSHYWKPTLERLGIPYRNLYQMRHSFASLMISNGEDILWVSNMLGHKHSSMTLEKYARYCRLKNRKRATFLEQVA
ncbi:tyrosine-type recombinase/integrase [Sulfurospirillum sp. hDNRA2]|uniref:tyrosine-type recombinase/integrase n=1 Tax=Sulfurospirillum sp. hDNRA2 TaxID=3237298 RepID=UPI0020B8BF06|nr:tyrosine-type recombinase/integrase [Sulfurospirillum sp. DNRA8]MCP3653139.1 site-specific integrase [Sulfurospirillum sp. DNRA8]MCR1811990.1 site-specific integrase [Sulfurospirillum sp. DNRA8]